MNVIERIIYTPAEINSAVTLHLRGMNMFSEENTQLKLLCLPSEKWEFAPKAIKFFLFRVDPFTQMWTGVQKSKQEVTKSAFLIKTGGKSTTCFQST